MQAQKQQILDRCKQLFARAQELYNIDLGHTTIRFDLRGRAAGTAQRRGTHYIMRFNADMLTREAFDHVLNDTVPHEIAHLLCFYNRSLGANHDSGWQRVCVSLGGSGATRHREEVVYGKGYTFEYITDRGHAVRVGDRHHASIQRGAVLKYRRGMGQISNTSACSVVGFQGRTMDVPRVLRAAGAVSSVESMPVAQPVLPVAQPVAARTSVAAPVKAPVQRAVAGTSKAAVSRMIMQRGYQAGDSYEKIIAEMIAANGYDRQLARGTFKANAGKVGIPTSFFI